jgi:hypothetical protein
MNRLIVVLVAVVAVLGLPSGVFAMSGWFYNGSVSGEVNGQQFNGTYAGTSTQGTFSGTSNLPNGPVSGTANVGGQQGTFNGVVTGTSFRGTFSPVTSSSTSPVVSATEPLIPLGIALGLLGARFLRRRR